MSGAMSSSSDVASASAPARSGARSPVSMSPATTSAFVPDAGDSPRLNRCTSSTTCARYRMSEPYASSTGLGTSARNTSPGATCIRRTSSAMPIQRNTCPMRGGSRPRSPVSDRSDTGAGSAASRASRVTCAGFGRRRRLIARPGQGRARQGRPAAAFRGTRGTPCTRRTNRSCSPGASSRGRTRGTREPSPRSCTHRAAAR